ncbi:TraB/GumN family protein [Neotabrizicola sp. sgz301269]|uniref:TraB/GumN family protein n=1 Tax=Neotabrizicola sp. sgz301269 TaxID=3276282 RepID=UPI003770365F
MRLAQALAPLAFLVGLALPLAPVAASAECKGRDLIATMAPEERARITALADEQPYANGNLWSARRGAESLVLVGTYHLDDPRHQATLTVLSPYLEKASALLVEAGPDEEKALMDHVAKDPSAMFITDGPTLLESLPAETWNRLSRAMAERGVPGFMASKFQPWYATVVLAIPPCAVADMIDPKGLDGLLIDAAQTEGVPVKALEPYDTVLKLFGGLTEADQIAMIEQTLATEDQAEDFAATLVEAYFRGESRLMWEMMRDLSYGQPGMTREQVDSDFALMEKLLMDDRNRAWIPVIDAAAAEGPLVVAFGALHLPGRNGVLNLLAQDGWTISPLQ